MSDFQKFVDLLSEYRCSKMSFDTFILKVKELKCNDFRWYHCMAFYMFQNNHITEAEKYISKAIELLKELHPNALFNFCEENCITLVESNGMFLFLGTVCEQRARIFQLAGEIYSMLGLKQEALESYKAYHYNKSFLKTEFEKDEVKLYSFRRLSKYSLSDLINKTITVCHPSLMNDPFDSLFTLWSTEKNLDETCSEKTHIQPYSASFDYFRIRSFSLCNPNNVLMWSHYGDEHRGFCIKYRLSKHFIKEEENDFNKHMYLKKIEYTNDNVSIGVSSLNSTLGFATKHRNWKYEKEVRLISYNPQVDGKFDSISLDSDSNIQAIYFGYRCSEQDMKTVMNICLERYKGIRFYKMNLNPNNIYRLKPKKIPYY